MLNLNTPLLGAYITLRSEIVPTGPASEGRALHLCFSHIRIEQEQSIRNNRARLTLIGPQQGFGDWQIILEQFDGWGLAPNVSILVFVLLELVWFPVDLFREYFFRPGEPLRVCKYRSQ